MTDKTQQRDILRRVIEEQLDNLFRFAYMRIGHREDSEDLVHNVVCKVWSSNTFTISKQEDPVSTSISYLFRSLYNACNNYFRAKGVIGNIIPIEELNIEPISQEDNMLRAEYIRVNKLLMTLTNEQAEVIRMHFYDELTFKQIADVLEIPEPTVKSRYRYAISNLQKAIKKEESL